MLQLFKPLLSACPIVSLESKYQMILTFTPLESPAACGGDDDTIPFSANVGSKAPLAPLEIFSNGVNEPSRWKVENFLTGFTFLLFSLPAPACRQTGLAG